MINRYEGNTGRVTRLPEEHDLRPPPPPERKPPPERRPPPGPPGLPPGLDLRRLLPSTVGELETEDLLLLLILYLMYRESGDQELLVIMGAMFLL